MLAVLPRRLRLRATALLPLIAAAAILEAAAAVGIMVLVRRLSAPDASAMLAASEPTRLSLLQVLGFVALFYLIKNGLWMIAERLRHSTIAESATEVAKTLFASALEREWSERLRANSAETVRTIDHDVFVLFREVAAPLVSIGAELLTAIAIAGVLLSVSPATTVGAAAILGFLGGLFVRLTRRIAARDGARTEQLGRSLLLQLNHALGSSKELKMFGRESSSVRSFSKDFESFARARARQDFLATLPRAAVETTFVLGTVVVVSTVILGAGAGAGTMSLLALYAYAGFRLVPSANRILWQWSLVRFHSTALRSLFEELARIAERPTAAEERPPGDRFREEIRVQAASVRYHGGGKEALRSITLTIPCGSSLGIVGATGAGKTTLVDALLGLLPVAAGRITVDGVDLRECRRWWQRRIGYVPQAPFLLDDSIRKNVALGVPDAEIDDERVRAVLGIVRLDPMLEASPHGLGTRIGENGLRLSGGERQRLGIARALYGDPEILVFDEATSALDPATEAAVLGAIEAMPGVRTLVRVAHRLPTVRSCDRLLLMRAGEVVACGGYERLCAESEEFRAFVGAAQPAERSSTHGAE